MYAIRSYYALAAQGRLIDHQRDVGDGEDRIDLRRFAGQGGRSEQIGIEEHGAEQSGGCAGELRNNFV